MIQKYLNDRNIKLILYFITLGFLSVFALRLNTPPVLDEVGTLANTADMLGYDWSQCVYIMGSYYYKYGMSVIYLPLMFIFRDPFIFYKSMLLLNMILLSFIPVIAYTIMTKHMKVSSKSSAALIAGAVGLLPSVILYSLYARADVLLIFLPWLILLTMLEAYQSGCDGNKKRQIVYSVLCAFSSIYAFMAHTRGIVFIIAAFMTAGLLRLVLRRKIIRWLPFTITTIIMVISDKLIANHFMNSVYGTYGTAHASAESFRFDSLKLIFTRDGLSSMIKLIAGWVYNVMTSTYGMAGIGFIASVIIFILYIRRSDSYSQAEVIVSVFALLAFLGTFALGVLFFFPVAHDYFTGVLISRADRLIYGRYTVCAVGPLVMLALYALIIKKGTVKIYGKITAVAIYIIALVLCITKVGDYLIKTTAVSRYFISLCTFLKLNSPGTTVDSFPNLISALLYAGILGLVLLLVILFLTSGRSHRRNIITLITVIVTSITIFSVNYYKIRLSRDNVLMSWTSSPVKLLNEINEITKEYPYVIKNITAKDIKHYQFTCRDYIMGNELTDAINAENYFIISKKDRFVQNYYADDYYLFDCFDYENASRDIVYVKGEALRHRLEAMGYKMIKYDGRLKKTDIPVWGV